MLLDGDNNGLFGLFGASPHALHPQQPPQTRNKRKRKLILVYSPDEAEAHSSVSKKRKISYEKPDLNARKNVDINGYNNNNNNKRKNWVGTKRNLLPNFGAIENKNDVSDMSHTNVESYDDEEYECTSDGDSDEDYESTSDEDSDEEYEPENSESDYEEYEPEYKIKKIGKKKSVLKFVKDKKVRNNTIKKLLPTDIFNEIINMKTLTKTMYIKTAKHSAKGLNVSALCVCDCDGGTFICFVCQKEFATYQLLQKDITGHLNVLIGLTFHGEPYRDMAFERGYEQIKVANEPNKISAFKCIAAKCGKMFTVNYHLTGRDQQKIDNGKPLKDVFKAKVATARGKFRKHQRKEHPPKKKSK